MESLSKKTSRPDGESHCATDMHTTPLIGYASFCLKMWFKGPKPVVADN